MGPYPGNLGTALSERGHWLAGGARAWFEDHLTHSPRPGSRLAAPLLSLQGNGGCSPETGQLSSRTGACPRGRHTSSRGSEAGMSHPGDLPKASLAHAHPHRKRRRDRGAEGERQPDGCLPETCALPPLPSLRLRWRLGWMSCLLPPSFPSLWSSEESQRSGRRVGIWGPQGYAPSPGPREIQTWP